MPQGAATGILAATGKDIHGGECIKVAAGQLVVDQPPVQLGSVRAAVRVDRAQAERSVGSVLDSEGDGMYHPCITATG